jgi:nitrogen-specific signal transduction histidine kinase
MEFEQPTGCCSNSSKPRSIPTTIRIRFAAAAARHHGNNARGADARRSVYMLVHDMRNPLSVMQNALQMLEDPECGK